MIRTRLSRRTLLRGLGASIALPWLEAMGAARERPVRFCFVYVPNGIDMRNWTPAAEGDRYEMPRLLKPLEALRSEFQVLSGLTHNNGRALGDGAGDHARAAATFLTGAHPTKTDGAGIHNGISVDQLIARKTVAATKFASLELGCENGRMVGNCDSGYSCAYSNTLSWRNEISPMPVEVNPRVVFERLFGSAAEPYRKSILDFAAEDARRLKRELGPGDNRKLDEFLYSIREIERRIEMTEKSGGAPAPSIELPAGVPGSYPEHVKLMFDLLHAAFQMDLTRVGTLMMAREGSSRTYREIGISDGHHPLTHHRNDPEMMEKVAQINEYHVTLFRYFLDRMKATPDGDGTLLGNSVIVYGSGLSDGNQHAHNNLPVLVAGSGGGALHPGRHVRYPRETPMTNLFVSLAGLSGAGATRFGDSSGKLW